MLALLYERKAKHGLYASNIVHVFHDNIPNALNLLMTKDKEGSFVPSLMGKFPNIPILSTKKKTTR